MAKKAFATGKSCQKSGQPRQLYEADRRRILQRVPKLRKIKPPR